MKKRILNILATAGIATLATSLYGAPITVTGTPGAAAVQQSAQDPYIFGDSNGSCNKNPATFACTLTPNSTSFNLFSATYTGTTILTFLNGGSLEVGLDINDAGGQPAETLVFFQMYKNGTAAGNLVDSTTSQSVPSVANPGNGYTDYVLTGFSSFLSTDTITFRWSLSGDTGGRDSVFLIAGSPVSITATPEPSTLAMLGSGLLGLGLAWRKRK